jgi:gluconokinase
MGVSGSGKSTFASVLARALDCPFLEGDEFHDAAAVLKMTDGHPLADEDRWPWLDRLARAIDGVLARNESAVAACSALRRSYRDRLRSAIRGPTRFILLDPGLAELQRRLRRRTGHYMPASLLGSQLATLERPGDDEAAMALTAAGSPEELCAAALAWLRGNASRTQRGAACPR